MGRICKFRRTLTRKELPSWTRFERASGPHKGTRPPNVPWEMVLACSTGEGVDVATYVALHETIDTDGLFDILEISDSLASWKNAALANVREGGA